MVPSLRSPPSRAPLREVKSGSWSLAPVKIDFVNTYVVATQQLNSSQRPAARGATGRQVVCHKYRILSTRSMQHAD